MKPLPSPEIEPGQLNRRIQIQAQTTTQDALGEPQPTWSTIYACWARITIVSAELLYQAAEYASGVNTRITIRYTSSVAVNAGMQIVYIEPTTNITHTYNVKAVVNDYQRNRQIDFYCYELDAQE